MVDLALPYELYKEHPPLAESSMQFILGHPEITQVNLQEYDPEDSPFYPVKLLPVHGFPHIDSAIQFMRNALEQTNATFHLAWNFGVGVRQQSEWDFPGDPLELEELQPMVPDHRVALPVLDFDSKPTASLLAAIRSTCKHLGLNAVIGHSGRSFHLILAKAVLDDVVLWQTWAEAAKGIMTSTGDFPHWIDVIINAILSAGNLQDLFQIARYIHSNAPYTRDPANAVPVDIRHLKNALLHNGLQRNYFRGQIPEPNMPNVFTQQFLRIGPKYGKNIPRLIEEIITPGAMGFSQLVL